MKDKRRASFVSSTENQKNNFGIWFLVYLPVSLRCEAGRSKD